jgi:acetyltransferase
MEEQATLPDGAVVRLRDVGPADAERLQDLVHHMSLADIRLRFFAPVRDLSPELVFRLSHPDPSREIAIAALPLDEESFLGVARIAADDTLREGEYAIAVRTDMKGHGVGYLLFGRLIERARALGIRELWGDVLRENDAMLLMAREHGFAVSDHPDEAELVRVRRKL